MRRHRHVKQKCDAFEHDFKTDDVSGVPPQRHIYAVSVFSDLNYRGELNPVNVHCALHYFCSTPDIFIYQVCLDLLCWGLLCGNNIFNREFDLSGVLLAPNIMNVTI